MRTGVGLGRGAPGEGGVAGVTGEVESGMRRQYCG